MKNYSRVLLGLMVIGIIFFSCTENYSNGKRIGVITKFSHTGLVWKTYEGHLNVTQTGMNTANSFDFSIDADSEPQKVLDTLNAAAEEGWKVELVYHETAGKNWFQNRGNTDYFVTQVKILEKNFDNPFGRISEKPNQTGGRVVRDTVYFKIVAKSELKNP